MDLREMKNVLAMAGYFAAQAAYSVSHGDVFVPIVGYLNTDASRSVERLVMDSVDAAYLGDQKINRLMPYHKGGAFVLDGVITLDSVKTDALMITVKFRDDDYKKIEFIVPYRNANHESGFAIYQLKIIEMSGFGLEDYGWITDAIFDGLVSHPEGNRLWQKHYEGRSVASVNRYSNENTELSSDEFERLTRAPFIIFFLISAIDGKVNKRKAVGFAKTIAHQTVNGDFLFNQIIAHVVHNASVMVAGMANQNINYIAELIALKSIVDRKLAKEDANQFKQALFQLGKKIAESSGGFLGFGKKITKEETATLATIALCLDVRT